MNVVILVFFYVFNDKYIKGSKGFWYLFFSKYFENSKLFLVIVLLYFIL